MDKALVLLWLVGRASAVVVDLEAAGGVAESASRSACWSNGGVLNTTLAALEPGDTLVIPNKTFFVLPALASNLSDVIIRVDGTLKFCSYMQLEWPRTSDGSVLECLKFSNVRNVTFTSSGTGGVIDGQGKFWWGVPGIGYLVREENRPRLLKLENAVDVLFERILLHQSPYWTFTAEGVDGLEIRYATINNRRDPDATDHNLIELTAFNTDGFDVSGSNVWIHDSVIWCQDDTVAVKDGSENMVFERLEASGVGVTIGSIAGSTVRNITFRNIYMNHTYKGIYMKFRGDDGIIEDVTYENIVIDSPSQWPIWIGPAQQSDSRRLCAAHPCSICWPTTGECDAPLSVYSNILLKNITVLNPSMSAGVILANASTPMVNVTFQDVTVQNPADEPWGDAQYYCSGVASGTATGKTWPVPPCFGDQTTH
ncbi:hypothetical protein CTAYLR_008175 [Chrysophaeum taylorii]|uniref:Uncharacterized protein n=1 Tax=Chrysophaeum taylorii TaxID=2483200 RepID=A0AAD7XJF7_9STRA|nr:hypothetical protein CTAYLR_008175 [Chrysophaeum taylorii]